jgi:hypothetical protein
MVSIPTGSVPPAAAAIRAIYDGAEVSLLRRIARRLAAGADDPGWAGAKLGEVLQVRAELDQQIADLVEGVSRERVSAVQGAYERDAIRGARAIEAVGGRVEGGFGLGNRPAIRALAQESVADVINQGNFILRRTADEYRQTVADAAGRILTGSETRREALQGALNRWADQGIVGFVDERGRKWDMGSYGEMSTRSAVNRAAVEGFRDTLTDSGYDLVIVGVSTEPCPICDPWEGRVLSLTGNDERYPSLADAIGEGLHHPNCKHTEGIYLPGVTRPVERVEKERREELYEQSQEQRHNERMIRQWKKREAVAIEPSAEAKARAKVSEWQARQRDFISETDRRRLYHREQPRSGRRS